MEIEYSYDKLVEAFNSVIYAEYSDAFPIHIWARYAKILADAFERVDGLMLIEELGDAAPTVER